MPTRSTLYLLVLLTLGLQRSADAQTPIYFWGLERDCEQFVSANRQAEKQLNSATQPFTLLQTPAGKPLPPCQGERCAQILRRACPAVSGRLLGGQVVQGRDSSHFRIWLYDLQTGQIAVQDDYTQNPGTADTFVVQAQALLANPRFGASPGPGPKPAYCTAARSEPSSEGAESKASIFLTVYGDGKYRTALHAALEQQLQLLGKNPQPVTVETRSYSLDVLQRIVSGQQNARVLGAEAKKDGTVRLFLFDQKTNLTHDQIVSCPGCERDGAKLILQVKPEVSALLEHCFSDQCASSGLPPPVEACDPFPEKQCVGLEAMLSPDTNLLPARHIDATTAKAVKGSLWGVFAVSAATTIGLAIVNSSVQREINGRLSDNTLATPAVAMAGVSIGLLSVAIPTTLLVNRAQRSAALAPSAAGPSIVQCPN